MKHKLNALFTLCLAVLMSALLFVACGEQGGASVKASVTATEDMVVVTIEETDGKATLIDAMETLKADGKLQYEISSGMVTSIGGKANETISVSEGYSWMLYTSDAEMANVSWGTVEYEGATYGSAALGAETLVVIEDGVYIWSYDHWAY